MDVEIREGAAADRAQILALLTAQLGEHLIQPPAEALANAVDRMLECPEVGRLLVAARGAELVGVAALLFGWSVEHGGPSAWLDELYVTPAERERSIGTALLRAACAVAEAQGCRAVELEIEEGHERAAHLYRREGFRSLPRQHWSRALEPRAIAAAAPTDLSGGCLCGAVRYRAVAAPRRVTHCHCGLCRRAGGAPFVTWATFAAADLAVTQGVPAERRSSPRAVRSFCAACGTALTFREDACPDLVDVTVGSLDRPELVTPLDHIHTASKLPWLRLNDRLPRHPGDR
jgi:GNAT superfamily N-acetyltransferase